jgi:hypothetical protein
VSTPAWILEAFAAVMLLVAEVSAGQLVVSRAWTRGGAGADMAISHLLVAIAIAGILVPGLHTLPDTVWTVVFALTTAWSAWSLWQESRGRGPAAVAGGHYTPQLLHSAALLYVCTALASPSAQSPGTAAAGSGGMSGMAWGASGLPTLRAPTLALLFALLLVARTVRDLDRRASPDGHFPVVERRWMPREPTLAAAIAATATPAAVKACQIATSLATAFILIIMI